jgi:3-oxoadipate enol-lactonase
MDSTASFVDLGEARLEYQRTRPTQGTQLDSVILLHPWRGCWQFWNQTVAGLRERDCYAVDLYSPGRDANLSYASPVELAGAVIRLLDDQRIDRCVLIGNSMGGVIAQVVAADAPARVAKLVLVGTGVSIVAPKLHSTLVEWLQAPPDRIETAAKIAELVVRRPEPAEFDVYVDALMTANREFMAKAVDAVFSLDLEARLGSVTAPTLVVRGEHDQIRSREHVRHLLDCIANSRAVEIAGAGHSPQVDSPTKFIRVLRAFLAGTAVAASHEPVNAAE